MKGFERVYRQLSLDYCCESEDIGSGSGNIFSPFEKREGKRNFDGTEDPFLSVVSVRNKLLVTGRPDIVHRLEGEYRDADAAWFMEAGNMHDLNRILEEYGYQIKKIHPFFISFDESDESSGDEGFRLYEAEEIERFRGDDRFLNAYSFKSEAPDVLGISAVENGEVIAMAGASADSPEFWQIGIDVLPKARGRGLGVQLVKRLRNEILKRGKVPYYGTAFSHTLSLGIAVKSGFIPGWTELITDRRQA
ncbi:MAG: GNAT family N-acetyltransferase [Lachnospiraceae bacterium]|nr:GNAT family N-acetyltransferase [Lachnospiraceae bacterium]